MKEPNAMSFHVKYKPEDFMPANEEEKQSQVIMRESVGFWQDGFRRLRKNKVAMVSLFVIIVVMIFSFKRESAPHAVFRERDRAYGCGREGIPPCARYR